MHVIQTRREQCRSRKSHATTQAWTERVGSADAPRHYHGDGHRQGMAGRPRTGVSAPTTVVARWEDLTAGPTGGAASGNSPVEGEEEVFKLTANGPLNIVYS
jgi:hypothetical protein